MADGPVTRIYQRRFFLSLPKQWGHTTSEQKPTQDSGFNPRRCCYLVLFFATHEKSPQTPASRSTPMRHRSRLPAPPPLLPLLRLRTWLDSLGCARSQAIALECNTRGSSDGALSLQPPISLLLLLLPRLVMIPSAAASISASTAASTSRTWAQRRTRRWSALRRGRLAAVLLRSILPLCHGAAAA